MSEEVLGSFVIEKIHTWKPNISYVLVLTSHRLVAARCESHEDCLAGIARGVDEEVLAGAFEAAVQGKKILAVPGVTETRGKFMLDPQTTLAADKNNFELAYSYITKVEMKKGGFSPAHGLRAGKMVLCTPKTKGEFELIHGQKFEECVDAVRSVLGNKLQAI